MTDFTSDLAATFLNNPDEVIAAEGQDGDVRPEACADPAKEGRSLRRGLIKAANLQDMLLER